MKMSNYMFCDNFLHLSKTLKSSAVKNNFWKTLYLKMGNPSDPLNGLKSFSIGGRMIEMRQRCLGMTDEERRWRAQFLKDQILSHDEPRNVPEYYRETTNVIRRLWRTPAWKFQVFLEPLVGKKPAYIIRHYITKTFSTIAVGWIVLYYVKYFNNDWTTCKGVELFKTRGTMFPDDPGYPNYYKRTREDYYDNGFYSSPLAVKVEKPPPPPPPERPRFRADGTEIVCTPSSSK